MTNLAWHELFPPRGVGLDDVTRLLRPLASRPHVGFLKRTPVVVAETELQPGAVRWRLGVDERLPRRFTAGLRAHLPGLEVVTLDSPARLTPTLGAEVRLSSYVFPIRLDTAESVSAGVLALADQLKPGEVLTLQWLIGPSYQRARRPQPYRVAEALGLQPPSSPTATEHQAWKVKTGEALFGVRARIAARAASPRRAHSLIRSVAAALALANSPQCAVRTGKATTRSARAVEAVIQPTVTWSSVVSSAELGALLGWPLGSVEVAGRATQLAPPPRSVVAEPETAEPAGRVLGVSLHPADHGSLVRMPLATSLHNLQVVGPTGSGKSTALAQMVLSDAEAGHGVLVLEPRGDLVTEIIERLPKHRRGHLVIIDPSAGDQVGVNPLVGPLHQAEQRADELAGLLRSLYGSAIGPRSGDVIFHAALTAARLPDGSLADIPILLSNPSFRRSALAKVSDPVVLGPWWAWFDSLSAGEAQQVVAPVRNKLAAFLARRSLRHLVAQPEPKFSFDDLFLRGPRIVLVNANRGLMGPEASRLLGMLILQSAWMAAQRRATLPVAARFPVSLVVDEFQDYVGALDMGEILSQCRGLGVSFTAAHQHLGQLSPQLQAAVTANARSRLAFRPSDDDARALATVFGSPVTPDDVLRLGAFQACVRLLIDSAMTPPFAVKTLPLGPATNDAAKLRHMSRDRYAADGDALDEALVRRWYGGGSGPAAPVATRRRPA
ncbi:type IV secretory system conjugative DNA transfer family protein [Amycolatopsis sp. CB00013]|uniref:type IV secretory system conjugative DNA transfer family protein n=1 Tax=Amycolatopsis sp. CB00013 TaxID=1703945 RepID=UPI0009400C72|nr:TraM recognition domain-containing protein [Amycolatopsis sp. CB00013]OKJ97412.1 hypothetical protein AMK34_10430 [Amycolatopsis sp. CB00013]